MSDPAKAVFLSYASQDTPAAERICEALRAAGVEVWFDRNELRGGDAWDQKIRRQIKECALFMPVISANTNARPEGYFRLEWKLAVDRSHLMSDDHPFLFPVVVDDTPDATARVPDRFREVQWTRLNIKDTPQSLAERVAMLLGGAPGRTGNAAGRVERKPGSGRDPIGKWIGYAAGISGMLIGLIYAVRPFWSTSHRPESKPVPAAAGGTNPAPTASRAQQLIAQARSLYEPWDFASVDDFRLAERLLKEAVELEPVNAEAYAATAISSYGFTVFGYDRSDARDSLLRSSADRAAKFAPTSDFTQLAQALRFRRGPGTDDEALRLLDGLAQRHPDDKFILRQRGSALLAKGREEDALACYGQAAALPGGDAIALAAREQTFLKLRRIDEAETAVTQAIALRPDYGYAHILKAALLLYERGDLERTKVALQEIPARVMNDDRVASIAAFFWFYAHEPDKASDALRFVTSDYVESNLITMPKTLLTGLVHRLAGRPEAAATEWRVGLRVLEQRLATNPNSSGDIGDKAVLLALLGERTAAEEALRVFEQLRRLPPGRASSASWVIYAELGRENEVADFFAERIAKWPREGAPSYAAMFRFAPQLDRFRAHPRFQALAAEVERLYARPAERK